MKPQVTLYLIGYLLKAEKRYVGCRLHSDRNPTQHFKYHLFVIESALGATLNEAELKLRERMKDRDLAWCGSPDESLF